jgi:hypothetical protein
MNQNMIQDAHKLFFYMLAAKTYLKLWTANKLEVNWFQETEKETKKQTNYKPLSLQGSLSLSM